MAHAHTLTALNSSDAYSSWTTADTSHSSISFLSDSGRSVQKDALHDLKLLLDLLFKYEIPGPHLMRVREEFNVCVGEGGEGKVYKASEDFATKLSRLAARSSEVDTITQVRLESSTRVWRSCVIKQLRSDGNRHLAFQTNSAYTEIRVLSQSSLRENRHIVKLLGWALCLDSLEHPMSTTPRLPLLILEKAQYDLKSFLNSSHYDNISHEDLCLISLGIGQGLGALHVQGMSHGDIKPTNVLLFEETVKGQDKDARISRSQWVPKLCDFRLVTTSRKGDRLLIKQRYKGTPGWKPPESYLEEPPISLQPCDIFAYGLVVWSIFLGMSSSPLFIKGNQDEESAIIRADIGQQTVYHRASQSLRAIYDLIESDVHSSLIVLAERVMNITPAENQRQWSVRTRRQDFLDSPRLVREEGINRVLLVLRESLNDDPRRRDREPWKYMDVKFFRSIGPVQDPARYSAIPQGKKTTANIPCDLFERLDTFVAHFLKHCFKTLRRWKQLYVRQRRRTVRFITNLVSTWLPLLILRNPKQQVYLTAFSKVDSSLRSSPDDDSMPYSFDPASIDSFDHESWDACHDIRSLYDNFYLGIRAQMRSSKPEDFYSHRSLLRYSFARVRSRVKLCCWLKHSRDLLVDGGGPYFRSSTLGVTLEHESTLIERALDYGDFATLAWLCRGEIGQQALQMLQRDPVKLWNWSRVRHLEKIIDLDYPTKVMCLLLEQGSNISQVVVHDHIERSAFHWYLQTLPRELDHTALQVCRHFRRIATEEDAPNWAKFYLLGHLADFRDDEVVNEGEFISTALHAAVEAVNYEVVEYLVGTDFNISVENSSGKTALQVAESRPTISDKADHLRNNQIIALLRQSKALRSKTFHPRQSTANQLPIGWEETKFTSCSVYRETSIESHVDSLTFIKPRYGLLVDNRLALGQREVKGSGQTYYIDPLRFMKKSSKAAKPVIMATEPTYGDEWFRQDVRDVTKPLIDPLTAKELWYRVVIGVTYFLKAVIDLHCAASRYLISVGSLALWLLVGMFLHDAWTSINLLGFMTSNFMFGIYIAIIGLITSNAIEEMDDKYSIARWAKAFVKAI